MQSAIGTESPEKSRFVASGLRAPNIVRRKTVKVGGPSVQAGAVSRSEAVKPHSEIGKEPSHPEAVASKPYPTVHHADLDQPHANTGSISDRVSARLAIRK